jgi:hypothetical protein
MNFGTFLSECRHSPESPHPDEYELLVHNIDRAKTAPIAMTVTALPKWRLAIRVLFALLVLVFTIAFVFVSPFVWVVCLVIRWHPPYINLMGSYCAFIGLVLLDFYLIRLTIQLLVRFGWYSGLLLIVAGILWVLVLSSILR